VPLVSRSRLAIHERHFSNGVWIYLGMGRRWRKDESAENIRFQVCDGGYIKMRDPENMRLWYTTPKTAMRRLESSRKSRISVSVSERDCIHNTLYYTSNEVNSQQPFLCLSPQQPPRNSHMGRQQKVSRLRAGISIFAVKIA